MPKQPGGVSKTLRVQTLIEILNRYGILDKITITEKVALRLALNKDLINRAIYRDLEDLVAQNKIFVIHKDNYGNAVDTVTDEKMHFKSFWYTEKFHPDQILGIGLLKAHDADLICAKNLLSNLSICEVNQITDIKKTSIIFNVNNRFFSLNFEAEALPFKLIITRKKPDQDILHKLNLTFSKRLAILILPDLTFPSIKNTEPFQTTCFEFEPNLMKISNSLRLKFRLYKEQDLNEFNQLFFKKDKTLIDENKNAIRTMSTRIDSENFSLKNFDLIQTDDTLFYLYI